MLRASCSTAALLAAYAAQPGVRTKAAIDEMTTM
jgi:hypothetical protein